MKKTTSLKHFSVKRRGDVIRITLSNQGRIYYENQCTVTDKKKLQTIISDLEAKGINFKPIKDWF